VGFGSGGVGVKDGVWHWRSCWRLTKLANIVN
jgi:hypothetical protein